METCRLSMWGFTCDLEETRLDVPPIGSSRQSSYSLGTLFSPSLYHSIITHLPLVSAPLRARIKHTKRISWCLFELLHTRTSVSIGRFVFRVTLICSLAIILYLKLQNTPCPVCILTVPSYAPVAIAVSSLGMPIGCCSFSLLYVRVSISLWFALMPPFPTPVCLSRLSLRINASGRGRDTGRGSGVIQHCCLHLPVFQVESYGFSEASRFMGGFSQQPPNLFQFVIQSQHLHFLALKCISYIMAKLCAVAVLRINHLERPPVTVAASLRLVKPNVIMIRADFAIFSVLYCLAMH